MTGRPRMLAFVPCRAGSERVPGKNTRTFAGVHGGLLQLKLDQLAATAELDAVVLDSNDGDVLAIGRAFAQHWPAGRELIVRPRPDQLGQSSTSTASLIEYALQTLDCEHLLWTHVTSPMVDQNVYGRALEAYRVLDSHQDSLMSVHRVQGFLWNERGPVNYDRAQQSWPRTQDLPPLFQVDSGIFLCPLATARRRHDRIGAQPKLFELSALEALDVDWEDDFALAELAYRARHAVRMASSEADAT
jgi:CMP-N-acetylneuraminic acid synthetase